MKNKEKFHDVIFDLACKGEAFAVVKGEAIPCNDIIDCSDCDLRGCDGKSCNQVSEEWCESEYVDPRKEVE